MWNKSHNVTEAGPGSVPIRRYMLWGMDWTPPTTTPRSTAKSEIIE